MGPSGSGKTTLGVALAAQLRADFVDADDLHPPANVEKMRSGKPLTDEDRWPWLDRVAEVIASHAEMDRSVVIACSALKRIYRDRFRQADPATQFVFLNVPRETLENRLKARSSHFMPATLVGSQLATLEPPDADERALILDATQPIDALVQTVVSAIGA